MSVPVLIVGDAPNLPTGLARIARDLTVRLYASSQLLDIDIAQLVLDYDGSPWPWRVYGIRDGLNWGHEDIEQVWDWHAQGHEGVVFTIWDPIRCYGTLDVPLRGAKRWGYFAIDAHDRNGRVGGPAAEVLKRYDRVLAYGRFGARVIADTLFVDHVYWLPHGIDTSIFYRRCDPSADRLVLGCVATNQPRKDLNFLFAAAEELRKRGRDVRLWLHTDEEITAAWSIPQLAVEYGFNDDHLFVTKHMTDDQLAWAYSSCHATIVPGLGEGFCYPVVESLACGVPVVAVDYGGAAELVTDFLVPFPAMRTEGTLLLRRPVLEGVSVTVAASIVQSATEGGRKKEPAYYSGQVQYLDWSVLWPRWLSWIRKGLA